MMILLPGAVKRRMARRAREPFACGRRLRRFIAIGKIGEEHWSAIVTCRAGAVRIVSVRRARDTEIEHYEGA